MRSSIAREPSPTTVHKPKSTYRTELLVARKNYTITPDHDTAISTRLSDVLKQYQPHCVGLYWPLPGEFNARDVLTQWLAQSASHTAALPVVVNRKSPLEFWRWTPESSLTIGDYGIPIPAQKEPLCPDLLLIPCLGFDSTCLRLGYGGGYYDRTLAACSPRPITIGLAYEYTHLPTLPREPHDVQLDLIISEAHCYTSESRAPL